MKYNQEGKAHSLPLVPSTPFIIAYCNSKELAKKKGAFYSNNLHNDNSFYINSRIHIVQSALIF